MMHDNVLFWLLLVAHLLNDFYFQNEKMAEEKLKKPKVFLAHNVIYALCSGVLLFLFIGLPLALTVTLLIAATHCGIDCIKFFREQKKVKILAKQDDDAKKAEITEKFDLKSTRIFVIDQCLHVAIISIIAYICAINNWIALNSVGSWLISTYNNLQIGVSPKDFLKLFFVGLIIWRPANILIRELNKKQYADNDDENKNQYKNAGKIIGTIERILVVVMILLNQYASIGLIFTAKTITRYNKISEEPAFAEYYLVGTLLSVLIAILSVVFVNMI